MTNDKKVLLLYAHPAQHKSEVNRPLFKLAQRLHFVTAVDLYEEYPGFQIDIDKEQQRLRAHDVVIFQFPLFWYSTPSILKEWQDLVLEHNFAYGAEGSGLHGKLFLCATTMGGSSSAYQASGYNHFTIRELLRPLEQTAELTGMTYLAPFSLFSSRTAQEEGRVDQHLGRWKLLLSALHHDYLDIEQASMAELIDDNLYEFIKSDISNGAEHD